MSSKILRLSSALAALTFAVACGGGGGSTGPSNSTAGGGGTSSGGGGYGDPGTGGTAVCAATTFCARAAVFDPTTLTVATGTAVTWENSSGVLHHIVFDTPAAAQGVGTGSAGDIGDIASGSEQRSFSTAGTYNFHCTIHPGMAGSLKVQ
jgi:plastocyanin